jgi:hypothetical protein
MNWFFIEGGPFRFLVEEETDWFLLEEVVDPLLIGGETG